MKTLLQTLLFLLLALNIYAAQFKAELLNTYFLGEKNTPTDVVLAFAGEGITGIYDAYEGSYLTYEGEKLLNINRGELLKGGNCFKHYGGFYYYCNSENSSVDVLGGDFSLTERIKLPENLKGSFDPTDLVILKDKIYIADNDNHRIIVYNEKKENIETIGSYGTNRLKFWYPYSLTMDSEGILLVSEVLGTRIQRIVPPAEFNGFIGEGWGIKTGEFYRPTGIALYENNHLFVADGYTGLIQIINKNGVFEDILTVPGGEKLKFGSPTHIRINGDILGVVDAWAKKVYIYRIRLMN